MDLEEIRSAVLPVVQEIHDESVRTTLLLFAFLGCVIVFAAVFLKGRRSPLAWIISLAIFSGLVLVRAGGLKEPEVRIVRGLIERSASEGPRCGVRLTAGEIWQLTESSAPGRSSGALEIPAMCSLSRAIQSDTEETLILVRGVALGVHRNGRSIFFRKPETGTTK